MKLDLTVNVPTLATLCVMVASTVTFGVRVYTDLDTRVRHGGYLQDALQQRVQALELAVGELRANQARDLKDLRTELRADLSEIKGTLNNLLYRKQP